MFVSKVLVIVSFVFVIFISLYSMSVYYTIYNNFMFIFIFVLVILVHQVQLNDNDKCFLGNCLNKISLRVFVIFYLIISVIIYSISCIKKNFFMVLVSVNYNKSAYS